ncbi:MAG: hypothetical protein IPL62_12410 [Caulobacteraceae bacterium]|nr:hypothetical protein [Caulobacteraceae bacterium]
MSYKLKLGVALVVAALALPTLAAAQDPSTRTDLTIIGAVLTDDSEQVADTHAVATPQLPIVYEDDAASSATDDNASAGETAASSEAE